MVKLLKSVLLTGVVLFDSYTTEVCQVIWIHLAGRPHSSLFAWRCWKALNVQTLRVKQHNMLHDLPAVVGFIVLFYIWLQLLSEFSQWTSPFGFLLRTYCVSALIQWYHRRKSKKKNKMLCLWVSVYLCV